MGVRRVLSKLPKQVREDDDRQEESHKREGHVHARQPSWWPVDDEAAKQAYFEWCRTKGGHLTTNLPMLEIDGRYVSGSARKRAIEHAGANMRDAPGREEGGRSPAPATRQPRRTHIQPRCTLTAAVHRLAVCVAR